LEMLEAAIKILTDFRNKANGYSKDEKEGKG
jgi:hypothetical protein